MKERIVWCFLLFFISYFTVDAFHLNTVRVCPPPPPPFILGTYAVKARSKRYSFVAWAVLYALDGTGSV